MRHFNNDDECPKIPESGKNICLYHPSIKVTYIGETEKTFDPKEVYGDAPNPTKL